MSESKERFTPGKYHAVGNKVLDKYDFTIAKCGWIGQDDEEGEANAKLLAAAPEMYELLDRIKGRLEFCKLEQSIDAETEHEIDALLRKARGEA